MAVSRARNFILPSVMTIAIVAMLIGLGVWQLERRVGKLAILSAMEQRLAAQAAPLPPVSQWSALTPADAEFRRVTFTATPEAHPSALVFAAPSSLRKDVSGTGVWAFSPMRLGDGATVVVNRGFVPDGQAVPAAAATSPETLTGYIRFPEAKGWLTPPPDTGKRMWFLRDHRAMAEALGWERAGGQVAPFYIDLESPVPPGGWPRPGPLQVNLKNDHLQYAITWFLLAIAVSIAFAVWVRGQRRKPV